MDWLVQQQAAIEQRLAKRHLRENTLVLYDLTSSYLEGTHCPLAKRGYSRDGKPGTLQIVFGLLCTAEGCPLAVEVFEGSTSDPKTVACQVEKIRTRFGLQRVVLVGDRGMLTAARIRKDADEGADWASALSSNAVRAERSAVECRKLAFTHGLIVRCEVAGSTHIADRCQRGVYRRGSSRLSPVCLRPLTWRG